MYSTRFSVFIMKMITPCHCAPCRLDTATATQSVMLLLQMIAPPPYNNNNAELVGFT